MIKTDKLQNLTNIWWDFLSQKYFSSSYSINWVRINCGTLLFNPLTKLNLLLQQSVSLPVPQIIVTQKPNQQGFHAQMTMRELI